MDPRYTQLAELITRHSIRVEAGDNVLIEAIDIPEAFVVELIRAVRERGGRPLVELKRQQIQRELIKGTDAETMELSGACEAFRMERMQCYIGARGAHNVSELSDVPNERMKHYQTHWATPVHMEIRVPRTRWVVMRWPHPAMAQQAQMSTEAFERFYFDAMLCDYARMDAAIGPLKARMDAADKVQLIGPGTDLTFSIKDIPSIGCAGEYNLPDGECFTAPVRDSVNGTITFNTPTIYLGKPFKDITLTFASGQIVEASADKTDELTEILDTDEGARYIGEFAIGFNPLIKEPMLDILFDEKIAGSFHFTPGKAYEEADNGNRSKIHWDMVMIQRPEYGGGEIRFDDELIRKDGLFVPQDLLPLNPDQLGA